MPPMLGGAEEFIFFDGTNGYCTYCTDPQRAMKFKSHAEAILGSNGLADPWLPWQAETWLLQSRISIGPVDPVFLMVYTVRDRTIHTHTTVPDKARIFFSEQEAVAFRDREVVGGDWIAVQYIDGTQALSGK